MFNLFSLQFIPILIVDLIVGACIMAIFLAVFFNFLDERELHKKPKKQKKSIVETGTMTGFFVLVYILLRFQIATLETTNVYFVGVGLVVMIFGTWFNIWGRRYLGDNWANQIKIYNDHQLVQAGPYAIVRHPLYASLIWMFYASALIYVNWGVFLANTFIFIPFMYYRAKQEEKLLEERFREYKIYKKTVGMFFPKITIFFKK